MSDELIELVRKYEVLYSPKCKEYKDHLIRTAAWEEIAQKLNEPVGKCKDNWTKLRNAYASAIKRRKNKKIGQAASQVIAWKYEKQMNFLRPHMKSRNTKTNLTEPTPESPIDMTPNSPPDVFVNDSQNSSASQPPQTQSSDASWSDGSQRSLASKRTSSANNKPSLQDIYDLMKSSNEAAHWGQTLIRSLFNLPQLYNHSTVQKLAVQSLVIRERTWKEIANLIYQDYF
ncbi:uncharacterized protein isoform X2 [Leptinotarsa decemlineata]|uniref:uncharacterized protein isoform X2 n=1 Tax=Leptinotarsa decemlineata TaxID=7539 RepID=UPI003D307881